MHGALWAAAWAAGGAPGAAEAAVALGWQDLPTLGALVASLLTVALIIIWQFARDRGKDTQRRHRDAGLLGVELTLVAEEIRVTDWLRPTTGARYERRRVPRGVYDGLAGSGRLADFDLPTQELLYRFYWHGSLGDHASMRRTIREAIDGVERIREESAPGSRAALGRLERFVIRRGRRRGRRARGGGPTAMPAPADGRDAGTTPSAPPARKGARRGADSLPAGGVGGEGGAKDGAPFGQAAGAEPGRGGAAGGRAGAPFGQEDQTTAMPGRDGPSEVGGATGQPPLSI